MEIELRALAEAGNVEIGSAAGISQLSGLLISHQLLDRATAHDLRRSTATANKAVHGLPVDFGDTYEALDHGIAALRRLQATRKALIES